MAEKIAHVIGDPCEKLVIGSLRSSNFFNAWLEQLGQAIPR
ncbi:hypothetical protein AF72_12675 [Xylella taiwanensis]|uniref:Uncharacterized protein n=1 Tax=Xylella taiwanensis TaxID=1444770 RepID=Z9JFE3_9GAMM|nr:hypothetical protein [Xylella taiwanensis]EWS77095.1 hypothetical protein AF72_12675 [Xylella taiwanensis]